MDRRLVDSIIKSLEGDAKGWKFRSCTAVNADRQTEIWIGNGRWGLDVEIGDAPKLGGVVLLALAPWRYRLWKAIKAARERRFAKAYSVCWPA